MLALLSLLGLDIRKFLHGVRQLPWYFRQRREFLRLRNHIESDGGTVVHNPAHQWGNAYPCLYDRNDSAGAAHGHYFWQDLWVAQRIFHENPAKHVDIGSSLGGFVAHVASFREIEVLDIRPLERSIPNVTFRQADLMSRSDDWSAYADSVSALHVIEHFGLGRYGDPLNPYGHVAGLKNLSRIVTVGGRLYVSFPTGTPRVEFNAHRVLSALEMFEVVADTFVFEEGMLVADDDSTTDYTADNFVSFVADCRQQRMGCALMALRRKP